MAQVDVVEEVELEESDDEFKYEEVEVESDEENQQNDDDFHALLNRVNATKNQSQENFSTLNSDFGSTIPKETAPVTMQPEVVDDFIRNFLVKNEMNQTLETFETEWYELKAKGKIPSTLDRVPDVYTQNQGLEDQVRQFREELFEAQTIASRASATWDKLRKERDFHRMHHKRVAQEKNKLINDMRRLKTHYDKYKPTIQELKKKYESTLKEKMLALLDRDKLAQKIESQDLELSQLREMAAPGSPTLEMKQDKQQQLQSPKTTQAASSKKVTQKTQKQSSQLERSLPVGAYHNPFTDVEFEPVQVRGFSLQKTFKGHLMSITNLAMHPSKPIVVTASDDKTWRMWELPEGGLIMSGEGHKDWVTGVDMHPKGICLATGSGDGCVKVWDFEKQACVHTFTEHSQAVWEVAFHHLGEYLASCSLDHSIRLFDLVSAKCKAALRGHVDSINSVAWQPYTNHVASASSDKTVSIWDVRSNLCEKTFYGHHNSCNHCTFNLMGNTLASVDADGVVKLWDVRMVTELMTLNVSEHAANKCCFDRSGEVLAVASDDGRIHTFSVKKGELLSEMAGHDDAVQAVLFDNNGEFMVSAGSDNTFRMWA